MRDWLVVVLAVVGIFAVFIGLVGGCGVVGSKYGCSVAQDMNPQLEYKFHWWTGCMVRAENGVLIHWSDYAAFVRENP